ncbi:Nn.00g032170.m01.CDS01 [Neocucurbitaria sp. VM-36]
MADNGPTIEATPFERALAQFKMGLKKRDLENFKKTALVDLRQTIGELQEKQHASRRLQGLNRIQPFLEAMDQFGKVITIFANTNEILAFVWGPVKLLLSIANTSVEAFKGLLDVYSSIGERLPNLIKYETLFRSNSHMMGVLALIYGDILQFHREALKYFQQPLWKQMLVTPTWKTYQSKFGEIMSNMTRHYQLVETSATVVQIEDFQKARNIDNDRFETERRDEELRRLRTVYDWLRPAGVENDHYEFMKTRAAFPDTGRWLLDHPTFQEWFDPQYPMVPPLLWLNGIPGAGKTILASIVVEEARKLNPTPTVLYFYCKYRNPEQDNFRAVARTILAQMLKQDRDLLAYFYEKCCESGEAVLESCTNIESLLKEGFDNCKSVYIVIDGLDECSRNNRKDITQWLRILVEDLPTSEPERIRCMFVSQDDGPARKDFSGLASLKIQSGDNKADIELYCRTQAEKLTLPPFSLAQERATAIAKTVSKSGVGMFLLTKLIWDNVFGQTSIARLEEELEPDVFPEDVNVAYRRILERIQAGATPQRWKEVMLVLGWLVCAKRPLKWHEIQCLKALNMEKECVDYNREKFLISPEELLDSLVVRREDGTVQFVHLSARYFLVDENQIDLAAEELKMATICLDYMNLKSLASPSSAAIINGDYSLLDYATLCWIRHLEAGLNEAETHEGIMRELAESLEIFLQKHWAEPTHPLAVSQRNRNKLAWFEGYEFFEKLLQSVISARKQITFFGKMKKGEVALNISDMVVNIRQEIERTMSLADSTIKEELEQKYSVHIYKCPRFSCQFFTTGFKDSVDRDKHVDKHERPFRCTEEACTGYIFGFIMSEDLKKHIRETHSRILQDEQFPTEHDIQQSLRPELVVQEVAPAPAPEVVQVQIEPEAEPDPEPLFHPLPAQQRTRRKERQKEFICNFCGNKYTKKYNWKSHLLTHTTKKPFKCTHCDKSFARESDMRRHETTHGEKTHVCYGRLPNGEYWGCGKSFARADILCNHHKTKVGQLCIRPLPRQQESEQEVDLVERRETGLSQATLLNG